MVLGNAVFPTVTVRRIVLAPAVNCCRRTNSGMNRFAIGGGEAVGKLVNYRLYFFRLKKCVFNRGPQATKSLYQRPHSKFSLCCILFTGQKTRLTFEIRRILKPDELGSDVATVCEALSMD